jgi:pimeloyl-ACP methyl ester carboxylesterase
MYKNRDIEKKCKMKNKKISITLLTYFFALNTTLLLCRSQDDLLSPADKAFLKKIEKKQKTFESKYFNTKFLSNTSAVEKALTEQDGFQELKVTTFDDFTINTFTKFAPNKTRRTIISAPGFFPGRAVGMATLYPMFKDEGDFNFMFVENRSHGKSEGPILTSNIYTSRTAIRNYGQGEYLDIAASIEKAVAQNTKDGITAPILLHGVCAGAHNSIKALAHLKEKNRQAYDAVDGIVFDSGWAHVSDIAENTIVAEKKFSYLKSKYTKPIADWILEPAANIALLVIYKLWFKSYHLPQPSITETIKEIDKPILFIHAENDKHVPFHTIQSLIDNAQQGCGWIIPESKHACIHLKQKEEYQEKVLQFITTIDKK